MSEDGFIKMRRSQEVEELAVGHPKAFVLLTIVAFRAKRRLGFNRHNLAPGEALVGDHDRCGLTMREYRTAKEVLHKSGFATFKSTNRGTVATLVNTRVFDINVESDDKPPDKQETTRRQARDNQTTTNKEGKKGRREEVIGPAIADPLIADDGNSQGLLNQPAVIRLWESDFLKEFGVDYDFDGGRDGSATAWILKQCVAEKFRAFYLAAWAEYRKRPTNFDLQSSRTIHGFKDRWQQLKIEAQGNGTHKTNGITRLSRNTGTANEGWSAGLKASQTAPSGGV